MEKPRPEAASPNTPEPVNPADLDAARRNVQDGLRGVIAPPPPPKPKP